MTAESDAGDGDDASMMTERDAGDGGDGGCPSALWYASTPGEPFFATEVPIEALCTDMICPPDLNALLEEIQPNALKLGDRCGLRLETGCGTTSVYRSFPLPALSWHYSDDDGRLVGVSRFDDVGRLSPLAGCQDAIYQAGEGPPDCKSVTTRLLCESRDGGL